MRLLPNEIDKINNINLICSKVYAFAQQLIRMREIHRSTEFKIFSERIVDNATNKFELFKRSIKFTINRSSVYWDSTNNYFKIFQEKNKFIMNILL